MDLDTPTDDMPRKKRVVETQPKTNGYGSEPKGTKLPTSRILDVLLGDVTAQVHELGPAFLEGIENAECKQAATLSISVKYAPPKDDDSPIGEFCVTAKLATKSIDRKRSVDISGNQLDLWGVVVRYQRIKVCCHGGHEHVEETFEADTAEAMVALVKAIEGRYTPVWIAAKVEESA